MTLITHIAEAIKAKASDEELNQIILDFITEHSLSPTVEEWRTLNYSELRRWAYPDITEKIDAEVKIHSEETNLQEEGQQQLELYYQDCLSVKERFPKL